MAGYIIYWSKEYLDKFLGKGENISVVYGGIVRSYPP